MNMAITIFPSDSGKSITKCAVIYCHFCSGSGIGRSTPAFFLCSDFINWKTGQDHTCSPTMFYIPRHQKALLMWSTVLLSPTYPMAHYWKWGPKRDIRPGRPNDTKGRIHYRSETTKLYPYYRIRDTQSLKDK